MKLYSMQGKYSEAVESLLGLEKQSRLAEDITSTKMCCKAILEVLFDAGDWQQLNEHILLLAKRRSQLKQVSGQGNATSCLLCLLCFVVSKPVLFCCRLFKHLLGKQWTMLRKLLMKRPRLSSSRLCSL